MVLNQALLVLAACALGCAALRLAARLGARSAIEQVLVAAPLGFGFVVCWTLLLGLAGLAGNALALAAGALAAWLLARLALPDSRSVLAELLAGWKRWPRSGRAAAGAVVGLAVGCAIEVALQPGLGLDALQYHLADVVGWLHSGHAGSAQTFNYDLPEGYYPVTNEVALTWTLGISRSFAPLAIWSTGLFALMLLGLWELLESIRVPRQVTIAALVAFGTLPLAMISLNLIAPGTDLPAVTWLAVTAALCSRARERPQLLGPALVATGLALGTKTTVVPLALVALAAGGWAVRMQLGRVKRWLIAGAAIGLLAGTPWYFRNWFVHGSPLWPFSAGPTGDRLPHLMVLFHESLLDRPRATVSALWGLYRKTIAGGLGAIVCLLAIPIATRSRAALLTAAIALGSLLIWAAAPFTGVAHNALADAVAVSTVRYVLAPVGACIVAISVAARDAGQRWRWAAVVLLSAATVYSLAQDASIGFPTIPKLQYLFAGGLIGAAIGAVAPGSPRRLGVNVVRVASALLAAVFLALSAPGWLSRESGDGSYEANVLAFMLHQPGFRSGSRPISFAPTVLASLAGPRLKHPIELIPAREPCSQVRARLKRGWVVVWPAAYLPGITTPFDTYICLLGTRPVYAGGGAFIYGPST